MASKLFVRRRDGRVDVRLNEAGRGVVKEIFARVVAAERDDEHEWHLSLNAPINPSSDDDDPLSRLARQSEISTNAELAFMTSGEEFLNDNEAWAWLTTIQVAMRSVVVTKGLLTDEKLEAGDPDDLAQIRTMQQLLFELSACF